MFVLHAIPIGEAPVHRRWRTVRDNNRPIQSVRNALPESAWNCMTTRAPRNVSHACMPARSEIRTETGDIWETFSLCCLTARRRARHGFWRIFNEFNMFNNRLKMYSEKLMINSQFLPILFFPHDRLTVACIEIFFAFYWKVNNRPKKLGPYL